MLVVPFVQNYARGIGIYSRDKSSRFWSFERCEGINIDLFVRLGKKSFTLTFQKENEK